MAFIALKTRVITGSCFATQVKESEEQGWDCRSPQPGDCRQETKETRLGCFWEKEKKNPKRTKRKTPLGPGETEMLSRVEATATKEPHLDVDLLQKLDPNAGRILCCPLSARDGN